MPMVPAARRAELVRGVFELFAEQPGGMDRVDVLRRRLIPICQALPRSLPCAVVA
jgi:hypothetical protein